MSLLLTVYNTPAWHELVDASGLPLITDKTSTEEGPGVLQSVQSLTDLPALLSHLSVGQHLWLATVQAEYFLAHAIESGGTLTEAAAQWEQQTNALLTLQRQHRRQLQLFNLHQALAEPVAFRECLNPGVVISDYPPKVVNSSMALLASCQYVAQRPELQALNTRLQASVLALCESEKLVVNIDQVLLQNSTASAAASERDVIREQLFHVQEELEKNISDSSKQLLTVSAERDKALQSLKKLTPEYNALQQERTTLESSAKAVSEERDLILAQLNQVQEQLEQYYLQLQSEQQSNKHSLLARDKQQTKEISRLGAELRKMKARAANAEYAGLLMQQELDRLRKSISWKAATPLRVLGRLVRKKDPEREKLMQDVGLLLTSEYFDVNWYLRTYTDVAESQMNPAEHYLCHGAAEGRLPGPLFDGNWYRQHYPDVAEANINPLLHFILYGQQEGRSSSPVLLTNTSQEGEE